MSKAGQPTKYKPEYCDLIVERAKTLKDYSFTHFCAFIEVDRDTLREWRLTHKEFSIACKKAKISYELRYRKILDDQMTGLSKGSATACIFYLKAQHAWRDDISVDDDDQEASDLSIEVNEDGKTN